MKKTVTETRQVFGTYIQYSLPKLIEILTKAIDNIPDETARNAATFEILDTGYYDPSYNLCIKYPRLETDEEETKRLKEEKNRINYEEALYKRLKTKFEK